MAWLDKCGCTASHFSLANDWVEYLQLLLSSFSKFVGWGNGNTEEVMHSSPFVVLGISVTVCTQNGHCLGSCVSRGISGVPNVWQLMHGEDRVLLVQSDDDDELKIHYLIVPVISNQFASFYVCVLFLSLFYLKGYCVQRWVQGLVLAVFWLRPFSCLTSLQLFMSFIQSWHPIPLLITSLS
jgi:hypothetical protein